MASELSSFIDKYQLALEQEHKSNPGGGVNGLELEWNIYDADFQPVWFTGPATAPVSFVDHLRAQFLPAWMEDHNKLEVFHWMTEWITSPHYSARHTIYEGWLLEACLLNGLAAMEAAEGGRYHIMNGNLLSPVSVGHDAIPGSWNIAKRRYLERCVDLYGPGLATAGLHVNLSLPETLLSWDFMHLSPSERGDRRFDAYKSEVYVTGTRLMRAFASLSIAVTASTPMRPEVRDGQPVALLTDVDSNRNLTFPNDRNLDVPYLYRSYDDYVRLSYDLINRGVRFGNNNWTPVRARSSADPVERIISITGDQLGSLYDRGVYNGTSIEEMARQIEQENLRARIDLPMSRVELRTDEGGHDIRLDLAHLTLVELLLLQFYADPVFARAFRYDVEDIARARRNESAAATHGLRAEIEDPFTGKPIQMREFLGWTLEQVRPYAEALNRWDDLDPLVEMVHGAPNAAEILRTTLRDLLDETDIVSAELLSAVAQQREREVQSQVEAIMADLEANPSQSAKLKTLIDAECDETHHALNVRIDFHPAQPVIIEASYPDKTSEIVALAQQLIRIPSVTNCPDERIDEVNHAARFIRRYLESAGLTVRVFDEGKYPAIFAHFPDQLAAPVMLSGHFDVVEPMPDDSQFVPRIDGDYLWGRGSADMKTVVATYMVWMKDQMKAGGVLPMINLLLVGNEENGEMEPFGTPHVLEVLKREYNYAPGLFIAGERTGEKGTELFGEVCVENRGVCRFRLIASGKAGHTGTASAHADLTQRLIAASTELNTILAQHLTLSSPDGWATGARFPFLNVGQAGVYNITATRGELGVEVRPIPQDDLGAMLDAVRQYAESAGLELLIEVQDPGIVCAPDSPSLLNLLKAVREASGEEPRVGRKLPGTSARFAPGGQGIVWGQSGFAPHALDERHYIPSIEPYYRALNALADKYRVAAPARAEAK